MSMNLNKIFVFSLCGFIFFTSFNFAIAEDDIYDVKLSSLNFNSPDYSHSDCISKAELARDLREHNPEKYCEYVYNLARNGCVVGHHYIAGEILRDENLCNKNIKTYEEKVQYAINILKLSLKCKNKDNFFTI